MSPYNKSKIVNTSPFNRFADVPIIPTILLPILIYVSDEIYNSFISSKTTMQVIILVKEAISLSLHPL